MITQSVVTAKLESVEEITEKFNQSIIDHNSKLEHLNVKTIGHDEAITNMEQAMQVTMGTTTKEVSTSSAAQQSTITKLAQ